VAVASTSSRAAFLFSTMTISGDGGQAPAAKRVRTALDELNTSGAFVRVESGFRGWVKEGGPFPPEKGRYILYVSYACPWAHRTLIVRALKGLEDAIDICVVHPTWAKTRPDDNDDNHTGWVFASSKDEPITPLAGKGSISCEGCIPDERYGFRFVRDIYEKAKDTTGKYSVPVLWDTQTETIVNNESSEICTMLNSAFDKFAANPQCDLEPSDLQQAQADVNAWIYTGINNVRALSSLERCRHNCQEFEWQ
jgi:putative glutathione S-transferase